LYEKYFKKVFTYILLKANWNTSIAEDITATTFMKAFENINKFSIDKNNWSFVARLYSIAYHAFLDARKYDSNEYITDKDSFSSNIDYTEYFQTNIQTEQILKYLEDLWSYKKDLFILRIRENLSYDEIANILWKRSSTCRKDFSKLIKKLTVHFKHFIDD
jgi:RNA polymerase sigma factor (sigma-70 family)